MNQYEGTFDLEELYKLDDNIKSMDFRMVKL